MKVGGNVAKDKFDVQDDWNLYQQGLDYKLRVDLFNTVDKNNRFAAGDQWNGVISNNLPTPVFNLIKRVKGYKVAAIMQNTIKIKYSAENGTPEQQQMCEILNRETENLWEKLKMDSSNEKILTDAFVQGDGITCFWWNDKIKTGQVYGNEPILGGIRKQEVDNVCIFPGDCNNPIINDADGAVQPYMMIVFRQPVSTVKAEAKQNGLPKHEINMISSDSDYTYSAGDKGKIELDEQNDAGKVNVILKMWKNEDTGTIWARKSTKHVVLRKEYDTELKLYPIAMMNWESVKNSFHGQSEVTGVIPNQLYINKSAAAIMLAIMHTSYPKLAYDGTRIHTPPSNQIGTAIKVDGNVEGAIKYLSVGQIAGDAFKFLPMVVQMTKDMMGANETAMGDDSITDTKGGILALQQAAAVPLKSIQRRFYQYIEDVALIWQDMFRSKYGVPRLVNYNDKGQEMSGTLDMSVLENANLITKIDVGPSTMWNEIASIQELKALLAAGQIDAVEYFERMPSDIIPDKQSLIEKRKAMQAQQQAMAQAPQLTPEAIMAELSPDEQAYVESHPEVLDKI